MKSKVIMRIMLTLLMSSIVSVGRTSSVHVTTQMNSETTVYLDSPTINGTVTGQEFNVSIMIRDAQEVRAWQAGLTFNPDLLNCTGFFEGEFLSDVGSTFWMAGTINNTAGVIFPAYGCTTLKDPVTGEVPVATGDGRLAYATFKVKAPGVSDIHLSNVKAIDINFYSVLINIIDVYTVVVDTTPHTVITVSNSTGTIIEPPGSGFYDHAFNLTLKEISFKVTGPNPSFSNVTIPKTLLSVSTLDEWAVIIDGLPVSRTVTENATHTSIYFTYTLGIHEVRITTRPLASSTISIALSSTTITLGSSVTISGAIAPVRPDVTVTILCRPSGTVTWTALATVTSDSNSRYSYTWTPEKTGTYEVKARWEGDPNTLSAESDVMTLTVREPAPDHELAVTLDAPEFFVPSESSLLNATVYNVGLSNETAVELQLLINGTVVDSVTISELVNGASYTLSYLWTPAGEATYNVTAYAPPVLDEKVTVNNRVTKLVMVTYPLINPVEGQWANYTLSQVDVRTGELIFIGQLGFTYVHYVSPYLINVTMWSKYPEPPQDVVISGWMVVNIMNRMVETDSGIYWAGMWYPGWIETNITLDSTINILYGTATVVGSRIIEVGGYPIDCWELSYTIEMEPLRLEYTLWYDKASGLWIGMESTVDQYHMELKLATTNIPIGVLPVASFTYSPTDPVVGETVTFDASASYDPNGIIASYGWDFGDGTTGTGMTVTHIYATAGTYTVTLTVTDDEGLTNTATAEVTVSRVTLDVDVGSIHFRGEMAEFYILVSSMGAPVDADISAILYYDGTFYADLSASVEHVAKGLYRVSYTIPTDALTGTYALVVEASYLTLKGTALKSFLLSPTLTGTLIYLNGTVAWIKTEIGIIEGRITSLEGSIATIETDVGTIKTMLEGWTGGTTSPITTPQGTFQILVLTTSTLEGQITFSDNTLTIGLTGQSGTTGTTNVVIPKQLLEGIESSIDKVVVTNDDARVIFTYTENSEAYVLQITYTHSTHQMKIYLAGLRPTPFLAWAVLVIVLLAAVATGLAFYILKIRKTRVA